MKADSYVKHGDVKALVCTVNKEKEKEKEPIAWISTNIHPSHYRRALAPHPPADAETRERRRMMDAASITAMVTSCCIEDRGWRGTGLWSVLAAGGGWWWWGGHTSQLQPQHTHSPPATGESGEGSHFIMADQFATLIIVWSYSIFFLLL